MTMERLEELLDISVDEHLSHPKAFRKTKIKKA
jgi:hypothetical protein